MPKYWLCVTDRENWKVIREKKIWGVPERRHKSTLMRTKVGDKVVIYLKQEKKDDEILEPKIAGVFEIISEPFKDHKRIFKAPSKSPNELYPWRVMLKEIKISEVDFKPLIPKLKFIKNKKKWHMSFFGKAMIEIPEEDFKLIERLL